MLAPFFEGLRVVGSKAAERELFDLGLWLNDAVEVLDSGFECSRSRRKSDKIERCLRKGNRVLRVVGAYSYNYLLREEVLVIVHVSIEGLKWSNKTR
ncbi:MAG: hypothetical protein Q8R15_02945 [Candidatus Micrarchaeota archaeon]|nr:hypothetical protein [Candidatus Micrarchaeota archaeon]